MSDDGEPVAGSAGTSGFGLVGMAERARLLGGIAGQAEPGSQLDGGAVLPRGGDAVTIQWWSPTTRR